MVGNNYTNILFSACTNFVLDSSVNYFALLLLIFCTDDALKASNEKQSVDTVDTGVQANYLAVAPG